MIRGVFVGTSEPWRVARSATDDRVAVIGPVRTSRPWADADANLAFRRIGALMMAGRACEQKTSGARGGGERESA